MMEPIPSAGEPEPVQDLPTPQEPAPQGWTYWDVAVVTAFAIGAQVFVYLAAVLGFLLFQQVRGGRVLAFHEAATNASFLLPIQMAWWALVFWIVYRIVRARDPRPFRLAVGWVRPVRPLGVYVSGGVLLAFSVGALARLLPKPRQRMPIEELFRDPMSAFLLVAFGVLIAPAIEELLFRGFLFPVIERTHGAVAAVLASAALFSIVHAPQYGGAWQNVLLIGYVGVVFGTVRAVSRSLVPSTLVHAAYNLTLFVGLYGASNGFRNFNF